MNNCSDFVVLMHLYIDSEPGDFAPLFAHLDECESCKALFRDYSALASASRALPLDVPEALHANIMRAVSRERIKRRNGKIARLALPFAACAAIAAAMFLPQSLKNAGQDIAGEMESQFRTQSFALTQGTSAATAAANAAPPAQAPAGGQKKEIANDSNDGKTLVFGAPPSFPALTRSLAYAEYILAYGGAELPDFGSDETWTGENDLQQGMTFWAVENMPDARESALKALEDAGFTVLRKAEGAPEGDPYADKILIVIAQ